MGSAESAKLLGSVLAEHRIRARYIPMLGFLTLVLLWCAWSFLRRLTFERVTRGDSTAELGIGIALVAAAVACLVYARRLWGVCVRVRTKGLEHRGKGATTLVRWSEIDTLLVDILERVDAYGRPIGRRTRYVLETTDRRRLVMDDYFARLEELGEVLKEKTIEALLPAMLRAWKAGEPVKVAGFVFDLDGVTAGKRKPRSLPWFDLEAVRLVRGELVWFQRGNPKPWWGTALRTAPNGVVLVAFLEVIGKLDVGTADSIQSMYASTT